MIIYNVTINIEENVHDAWLKWMKEEHLPMVMGSGKFRKYYMFRILSRQADETGVTYAIQYFARNMEEYEEYRTQHAPALQEETKKKFDGKFVAFRTLMELEHHHEEA